jgi:uncharacterized protein YkwD
VTTTARPLLLAAVLLVPAALSADMPPPGDQEPQDMRGILAAHNKVRARHCAPPLVWSAEVAKVAQGWANQLRDSGCSFEHSKTKYGENLAAGTSLTQQAAVDMWYAEVGKYDFARPGFSMSTGHFTQVVWVGSQRLGCGVSSCKGMRIWVCNYDPPGNFQGRFPDNVKPTSCSAGKRP